MSSSAQNSYLTSITTSNESELYFGMRRSFEMALECRSKLPEELFGVNGFSGRKFRMFLNNLFQVIANPRYLEIGVLNGGSFIPAIHGNQMKATALDNWSWEGGNSDRFKSYLSEFGGQAETQIINSDFRAVDFSSIGPFNVMFYDGSHLETDQLDGVMLPVPAMDENYIVIVDDWNWEHVRRGTFNGLRLANCRIGHMIELRTTVGSILDLPPLSGMESDWHNGMFAAVVTKGHSP
jgi:hypothetical protein